MLTLRTAASDADLEQWRQVRLTVVPGERADSVAEIRAADSPARLLLLAEQDGVLAGSGVAGGEVIGVASLLLDPDEPARAETGYTAVRREWRGKGVADALKRSTLAWAAGHGIAEVYTWTQQGNARMRAVNERLGYRYGTVSIRLESPLPLSLP